MKNITIFILCSLVTLSPYLNAYRTLEEEAELVEDYVVTLPIEVKDFLDSLFKKGDLRWYVFGRRRLPLESKKAVEFEDVLDHFQAVGNPEKYNHFARSGDAPYSPEKTISYLLSQFGLKTFRENERFCFFTSEEEGNPFQHYIGSFPLKEWDDKCCFVDGAIEPNVHLYIKPEPVAPDPDEGYLYDGNCVAIRAIHP